MRWTATEREYVREHARCQSAAQMAFNVGHSTRAVTSMMHRLGVKSGVSKWHDAKRAAHAYVRDRAGTLSCAQMARELGVTTKAVWLMCRSLGMPTRPRGRVNVNTAWYGDIRIHWTPEEFRRLEEIKKARAGVQDAPSYVAHDFAQQMRWGGVVSPSTDRAEEIA